MLKNKNRRGFTLIELLVVIVIIGILAAIVFVAVNSARQKAKIARAKEDIHQIIMAMELYRDKYGKLPPIGGAISADFDPCNLAEWGRVVNVLINEKFGNEGMRRDSWGNPYCYDDNDNICCGGCTPLYSMGPNGKNDTWFRGYRPSGLGCPCYFANDDIGQVLMYGDRPYPSGECSEHPSGYSCSGSPDSFPGTETCCYEMLGFWSSSCDGWPGSWYCPSDETCCNEISGCNWNSSCRGSPSGNCPSDETCCNETSGCNWDSSCRGSPSGNCPSDETCCNETDGCYWNYEQGSCDGWPDEGCPSSENCCSSLGGCDWEGGCDGWPDEGCPSSENCCSSLGGCDWEGSCDGWPQGCPSSENCCNSLGGCDWEGFCIGWPYNCPSSESCCRETPGCSWGP